MNDTKSPFQSIGIMGPAVSMAAWLLNRWLGIGVTGAELGQIVETAAPLVGMITGIYGRWRATKQISGRA